jgi:hypothetical protein
MSTLRQDFPDGARFYRNPEGELALSWELTDPAVDSLAREPYPGYNSLHKIERHMTVQDWVDLHTIDGTTYDVIETGGGEIVSVVLSLPGGGVSAGPVVSRRFRLVRYHDVSGISGTGVVAHGVQMPDGFVALRWCVPGMPATWNLFDAIEHVELLNGHQGKTEVEWID